MNSNETSRYSNGGTVLLLIRTKEDALATFISLLVLTGLLVISGLIVNSVVCYVMIHSKLLYRNMSNVFIFHLSVADLVFRVLATPFALYSSLPSTEDGSFMCKLSTFISSTCSTAVFISLAVIAEDRYRNIVCPLESRVNVAIRKPRIFITCVWMYSVVCSVCFLFTTKSGAYTELPEAQGWNFQTCDNCSLPKMCDLPQDWTGQVSSSVYFAFAFLLPLGIMAVLYTKIVISLRRRSFQGVSAKRAAKSKGKAVRMMVLVLAGFVFTWGPGIILSVLRSYGIFYERFNEILVLSMVAEIAKYCSSLVNPLIYAYYSPYFRRDFVSAGVCCGRCKKITRKTLPSMEMQNIHRRPPLSLPEANLTQLRILPTPELSNET